MAHVKSPAARDRRIVGAIRSAAVAMAAVAPLRAAPQRLAGDDWLVTPPAAKATVTKSADGRELVLANGLVRRVLRLLPEAATVALDELTTGATFVRAVEPEATLVVDGRTVAVGGLTGQPDRAYLRDEWLDQLQPEPGAFQFRGMHEEATAERFPWKRVRHAEEPPRPWPPPGRAVVLEFAPPRGDAALAGLVVEVHYELYDGLPLFSKWLVVRNGAAADGAAPRRIDRLVAEQLSVVEAESRVDDSPRWTLPNLTVVTDLACIGVADTAAHPCVQWLPDPAYTTQVNYTLSMPCRLVVAPPLGPGVVLALGARIESPRVFELLHDSTERERKGLAVRRMVRTLAPWTTENPLLLHLTSVDPAVAQTAMEQAHEVGFEMVILSFGSGLDMEDVAPANVAKFKALADFAHGHGLELGGYSLLASRRIDDANDCINAATGKCGGMIFGNSPCLGSAWGQGYFDRLTRFLDATGFDVLEHDGSYPGDPCASTTHPGHAGLADSQWTQFATIAGFYRRCRARGLYLNVPDNYFLQGSSKNGMGYRESNWSLPRAEQHVHARQHLFDGTWEKAPSMGWMFVPLVQYQGGGTAATIEPLADHLDDYQSALTNCLGFGAQACYRGPRLYDGDATKALVAERVAWFLQHRAILESDVIHLRRADGRDWDGILHVNPAPPAGSPHALAMFWNPTARPLRRSLRLPLHYAGVKPQVQVEFALAGDGDDGWTTATADADAAIAVDVEIPANGSTWVVIR